MADAEAIIRLFIEKSWAIGVLFVATCGLALLAETHGAKFPSIVHDWALPVLLLGCGLIALSIINVFGHVAFAWISSALIARQERQEAEAQALRNLQTLSVQEQISLLGLLKSSNERYEVHSTSDGYRLMTKGILVEVQQVGGMTYLCEIHPAILKIKERLIGELSGSLQRYYPTIDF